MPLPTRIGRLRPPVLCFVVSKADAKDGDIEKLVKNAVAGGVDLVQLRDHDMPAGEMVELARKLKNAIARQGPLVINDRVDVAQAVEGVGLHIPETGLPTRDAKHIISRYEIIGRSVHGVDAGRTAASRRRRVRHRRHDLQEHVPPGRQAGRHRHHRRAHQRQLVPGAGHRRHHRRQRRGGHQGRRRGRGRYLGDHQG